MRGVSFDCQHPPSDMCGTTSSSSTAALALQQGCSCWVRGVDASWLELSPAALLAALQAERLA
jgi:hypothetical protein